MEEEKIQQEEKVAKKPFKRYIFGAIGIIVALIGIYLVIDAYHFQSTDDAYVETTTVQVAPKITGQVVEVYVTDNQRVKEGDLVAKIDDADYKVRLAQAEARYERALLNQKNAKANLSASKSNIDVAKKIWNAIKTSTLAGLFQNKPLILRRLNMTRLWRI